MRYRSTDTTSPSSATRYGRTNCTASYSPTVSTRTTGMVKEIWDCVTPGYYRIRSRGGVFPYLPVTIKTTTISASPLSFTGQLWNGSIWCQDRYGSRFFDDAYFTGLPPISDTDSQKIAYVTNAAIASAKSEAFDALTAFAEVSKSVGMVSTRIRKTFDFADKAAKKASRERGFRRQAEVFNSAWLEFRYGWRPLIHEIGNACEQFLERKYSINRCGSSAEESIDGNTSKNTTSAFDIWTGTSVRSGTRTYRGFALAVGNFGDAPEFRPIQTAWELVPFSFVVDWFFDVGSYLSAITPIPGVDIRASGYSIKDSYTTEYTVTGITNPSQTTHTLSVSSPESRTVRYESYSRVPHSSFIPAFYPRLSTLKAVDIASLVFQRAAPLSRFISKR